MKRLYYILFVLILAVPLAHSAWDNTEPADSTQWNVGAQKVRNNNNALEVVLGIDLSMEGSASPWYQATAPTTVADGSTALAAGNNGLLWVDSDTRILYGYIHGTGFRGLDSLPAVVTFTAADATPTVVMSSVFTTDSGGLTITDFDDGTDGKVIYVLSKGAVVYDTTTGQDGDHNLDGSSTDITTASGDITVWRNEGGTTWHLTNWNDASIDNGTIVVKSYVDNRTTMVPAISGAGTGYGGEQSVTFANGLIIKMGEVAAGTTVTFGTAFPTAVVSITVTFSTDPANQADDNSVWTDAVSTSAFTPKTNKGDTETVYWIAIGY